MKFFILFLTVLILTNSIFAQSSFGDNIPDAAVQSCEEFSARVDSIRNAAKTSQQKVFVIFHAGKTESEIVNTRRMTYVRDFLVSDSKLWSEIDVTFARGEKSKTNSVIAFYLGGNLLEAMSSPKNMTPVWIVAKLAFTHRKVC